MLNSRYVKICLGLQLLMLVLFALPIYDTTPRSLFAMMLEVAPRLRYLFTNYFPYAILFSPIFLALPLIFVLFFTSRGRRRANLCCLLSILGTLSFTSIFILNHIHMGSAWTIWLIFFNWLALTICWGLECRRIHKNERLSSAAENDTNPA